MKIAVAMSGGVDSSVAAGLLRDAGNEVSGITLLLKPSDTPENYADAVNAAGILGIEHCFLDLRQAFKDRVLRYAWDECRAGRTPNPCCFCNRTIKFGALADYAKSIGAESLATGHYGKIQHFDDGGVAFEAAADVLKDQAYFLSLLTPDQLKFCTMPLGNHTKDRVRILARAYGLGNAEKAESQDACFLVDGEFFGDTLAALFPGERPGRGRFVTPDGRAVGVHQGIHRYTIGQRRNLGVALGKPAYVTRIDAERNEITISTDKSLLSTTRIRVGEPNCFRTLPDPMPCLVQVRYAQTPKPGVLHADGEVILDEPQSRPALGQVAAFYFEGALVAGGFITGNGAV